MTEQGVQVKITEKADALPGERVRAVGMCFYKPVMDLVPGNSYRLCRNPQNPRDASCIEVKHRARVRAVLNRDVARDVACPVLGRKHCRGADLVSIIWPCEFDCFCNAISLAV